MSIQLREYPHSMVNVIVKITYPISDGGSGKKMGYVGGKGYGCGIGYGGFTSIGAILVLFILLVIILRAWGFGY